MQNSAIRFYNMKVRFIKNDKIFEENVAIKNVWEKDGNTFFDIYFYRNRKSHIFDAMFIHDITDLSTEKYYKKLEDFLVDFRGEDIQPNHDKNSHIQTKNKLFENIKSELLIMAFFGNVCKYLSPIKEKIIFDYILHQEPRAKLLSNQYLQAYVSSLTPSEEDFYEAISNLDCRSTKRITELCHEILKIAQADGRLHYREKVFLAEMLQILREAGIKVNLCI
ncbi:MAG: hypothetical protein E7018_01020 [Alphaproteobacteria bacterium]|nr:hypothetical protein [Alphaproteobacteria bacterium]